MEANEGTVRSKDETLEHYQSMLTQAKNETMVHKAQLVALFDLCDERGRKTILAIAGVQVKLTRGVL